MLSPMDFDNTLGALSLAVFLTAFFLLANGENLNSFYFIFILSCSAFLIAMSGFHEIKNLREENSEMRKEIEFLKRNDNYEKKKKKKNKK
jgi:hypothetical protein